MKLFNEICDQKYSFGLVEALTVTILPIVANYFQEKVI